MLTETLKSTINKELTTLCNSDCALDPYKSVKDFNYLRKFIVDQGLLYNYLDLLCWQLDRHPQALDNIQFYSAEDVLELLQAEPEVTIKAALVLLRTRSPYASKND